MVRLRGPRLISLWLLLSGCGGPGVASLTKAVVDTLPGGTPRVLSSGPTGWKDSAEAGMVEEARFGGEEGSQFEIGQPRSMAVDEAGRVYVVDTKPSVIKVFAPDGQPLRTIGREGEGPGEFRVGFVAARNGMVVLHDPQIGRTSVFDTAGAFLRSWRSSCCYWTEIQIDHSGRIYIPSVVTSKETGPPRGMAFVRWSSEGSVVDTLWVPRRESGKFWTVTLKQGSKSVMSMNTSVPFMPQQVYALHPDSGFVLGWNGDYLLVRSVSGGDTSRVFGRQWSPEPISEARRRAEAETRIRQSGPAYGEANVRSAFRVEDIPGILPAFMNLHVDWRGRTWIRRYAGDDTTRSYFDLFDPAGAYLGPVRLPARLSEWGQQVWTRDGLVAIIEDQDGRPRVVRYRLSAPKPAQ